MLLYMRKLSVALEDLSDAMDTPEKEQRVIKNVMKKHDIDQDGFVSPLEFYGHSYHKFKKDFELHEEL